MDNDMTLFPEEELRDGHTLLTEVWRIPKGWCYYCSNLYDERGVREHEIPKSENGKITRPSCAGCNGYKNDKAALVFIRQRRVDITRAIECELLCLKVTAIGQAWFDVPTERSAVIGDLKNVIVTAAATLHRRIDDYVWLSRFKEHDGLDVGSWPPLASIANADSRLPSWRKFWLCAFIWKLTNIPQRDLCETCLNTPYSQLQSEINHSCNAHWDEAVIASQELRRRFGLPIADIQCATANIDWLQVMRLIEDFEPRIRHDANVQNSIRTIYKSIAVVLREQGSLSQGIADEIDEYLANPTDEFPEKMVHVIAICYSGLSRITAALCGRENMCQQCDGSGFNG